MRGVYFVTWCESVPHATKYWHPLATLTSSVATTRDLRLTRSKGLCLLRAIVSICHNKGRFHRRRGVCLWGAFARAQDMLANSGGKGSPSGNWSVSVASPSVEDESDELKFTLESESPITSSASSTDWSAFKGRGEVKTEDAEASV